MDNNYGGVNYDNNKTEGSWDSDGACHVYWLRVFKDLFSELCYHRSIYSVNLYYIS